MKLPGLKNIWTIDIPKDILGAQCNVLITICLCALATLPAARQVGEK